MKNPFSSILVKKPKRSYMNLSYESKLSCQMGALVPIMCKEVVPGDTFKIRSNAIIRFSPLLGPVMSNVKVYMHYFFVPNRLLWDNWNDFITGGPDGTLAPEAPYFDLTSSDYIKYMIDRKLGDYLGLPLIPSQSSLERVPKFSSMPFRAYQLIYNEYYRDQNLTQPVETAFAVDGNDQNDIDDLTTLRYRSWRKDYFTSALPWAQRGNDVATPLTGNAPVIKVPISEGENKAPVMKFWDGEAVPGADDGSVGVGVDANSNLRPRNMSTGQLQGGDDIYFDPNGSLEADMAQVTGVNINELRRSMKIQEFLEKNARGGSRYIEMIFSHFGVKSSDSRLQRPEYLGGSIQPVNFSAVLQTSQTTSGEFGQPLAQMGGYGISGNPMKMFSRFFEEHGYVIGIMSVIPDAEYYQGLPKMFSRFDKLDYYWPSFAHLGEQEIKLKELYLEPYNPNSPNPPLAESTFGYTGRYNEYRYSPNEVHGDMRNSLNFLHLARNFSEIPKLNQQFVECHPSTRIFAIDDESTVYSSQVDKIWCNIVNTVYAKRPIPKYGTPYF